MADSVCVSWLSVRACHAESNTAAYLPGLSCTMVALGVKGAAWLERVGRAPWYEGFDPRPGDVLEHHRPAGEMTVPSSHPFAAASLAEGWAELPRVPLISLALLPDLAAADWQVAALLTRALMRRAEGRGTRSRVAATVSANDALHPGRIQTLREAGAFVIVGDTDVPADHLHHYPVRAVTIPLHGQLIGVDLADHLLCWPEGGVATLSIVPFVRPAIHGGGSVLERGSASALCLNFHLDRSDPASTLFNVDAFADHARQAYLDDAEGTVLFTTRDRPDGATGTVDLLRVHGPRSRPTPPASPPPSSPAASGAG